MREPREINRTWTKVELVTGIVMLIAGLVFAALTSGRRTMPSFEDGQMVLRTTIDYTAFAAPAGLVVVGVFLLVRSLYRLRRGPGTHQRARVVEPSPRVVPAAVSRPQRNRGLAELIGGIVMIIVGIAVTAGTYGAAAVEGGTYVLAYGPIFAGIAAVLRGVLHLFPDDLAPAIEIDEGPKPSWRRTAIEVVLGLALVVAGVLAIVRLHRLGIAPKHPSFIATCALLFTGLGVTSLGVAHLLRILPRLDPFGRFGYRSFVAWRYLLVFKTKVSRRALVAIVVSVVFAGTLGLAWWKDMLATTPAQQLALVAAGYFVVVDFWGVLRHSRAATIVFLAGVVIAVGSRIATTMVTSDDVTTFGMQPQSVVVLQVLSIATLVGGVFGFLAMFFGTIRAFFTFFTTVPIGGVWIGTAALVCVLSVMSGFETDLRQKILGSNAHIQITREDGEFVDWREAKRKIDRIPGVVASTPYAVSEVVIAANNNGMNVIIKGIDPATVGRVTDLVSDLEDDDAMRRLEPLADDTHDRDVPQRPRGGPGKPVVDPPPDDMPNGSDPIDFSAKDDDEPEAKPDARPSTKPDAKPDAKPDTSIDAEPFGGDAIRVIDADDKPASAIDRAGRAGTKTKTGTIDPPPADLLSMDEPPADYSGPTSITDGPIHVVDIPLEPSLSRRTQALPGILVGRELVKQTHLYTGEEVRVVSPLSDPSNPDATGTPIPFNRDYRVAGVFFTGMYEYDLKYVYVTLDSLQDFLDRGDAIDGIEVRISHADDTDRYIPNDDDEGLISEALGSGYRVVDWRELNRSLFSALKLEKIAMFIVLGIVILVASFSIVGNLIMVVVEKAREIALLKTLGASDRGMMQLFAIQGLMIGMIGTTLGVVTGRAMCWAGERFGLPLNQAVYYIDRLPIHVDWSSVMATALAGVLISIAATFYPAMLAARVRPAAGMRH